MNLKIELYQIIKLGALKLYSLAELQDCTLCVTLSVTSSLQPTLAVGPVGWLEAHHFSHDTLPTSVSYSTG